MQAKELNRKYCRDEHIERGTFVELGEQRRPGVRDAHGAIYYYVAPGEHTKFHRIDCDEYWCYHAGADLEVWCIDDGHISVTRLGCGEDCVPLLLIRQGTIFASRSRKDAEDGTFLSCITVPRFAYKEFTMWEESEIRTAFPELAAFYEN